MALYQTASVVWKVAKDSTLAQLLTSVSPSSTDSANLEEHTSQVVKVADSVTDQVISLGGIAAVKALLIVSDRKVTVKLDGEAVTIGHTDAAGGFLLLCPANDIAAILASNASGDEALIDVYMVGA
ncbi:MAG: hypothetical protein U9Q07_03360 [Planctomycetota bacterium]|nr:hypothetical protein [Planctomycetota bacterium]